MVAFSNLELKLMILFESLTSINEGAVAMAILDAMRFREKVGLMNKLVQIKVTHESKLTVWKGVKRQSPEHGIKGIYGHLQAAGDKRNQIAHATAANFTSNQVTKVRLVPNLANDAISLSTRDLIDRINYFTEVAKMLDWFIWADAIAQGQPGKPPPKFEIPIPDLVRPLLNEGSQIPTTP